MHLSRRALGAYLSQRGYDVALDSVVRISKRVWDTYTVFADTTLIEMPFPRLMQSILYQLHIDDYVNTEVIAEAIEHFYSPVIADSYLLNGALNLLTRLHDAGLWLGLVTDNESDFFHTRLLQKHGLEQSFDSIIVSCRLGIRKPHRAMFFKCLDALNVTVSEAVFIGDKPIHDICGAKYVGLRSIWMKRKGYQNVPLEPDWTVNSIQQLEATIFKELLAS
jgi:HAD superfamily hydrolase (TIGR01509 family)